jgi:hypothetical protein
MSVVCRRYSTRVLDGEYLGVERTFSWSGEKDRAEGVGVLVRDELVEAVIEVEGITPRIMNIKKFMGQNVGHIFSVYASQAGRPEGEKESFWGRLNDEMS